MADDGSYEALLRDFAVRKLKAGADGRETRDASAAADAGGSGLARSRDRARAPEKKNRPPSDGYVCERCDGKGHYIHDCPMRKQSRRDDLFDRRGAPPRYDDRAPRYYDDRGPPPPPRCDTRAPPAPPRNALPQPPPLPTDAEWSNFLLRKHGRRPSVLNASTAMQRRGPPPPPWYENCTPPAPPRYAPPPPPRDDHPVPPPPPRYDARAPPPPPRHAPPAPPPPPRKERVGDDPSYKINGLISGEARARELLDLYQQHGQSFTHVNLSTCWSRLGRVSDTELGWLRSDEGARLLALREQTRGFVRNLNSRHLSSIAHALAKLALYGAAWASLWKELEVAVLARTTEFTPQGLANTAWAFATARQASPALLDAFAAESAGRVRGFKPQELANTAWAYATAGHAAPALFDAIAEESTRRVRDLNSMDLANTVWAFATAGHAAPALFDAIAAASERRVREFNPQDLANTAWGFAKSGVGAPALFDAIAAESARRVREFSPQELSNIVWAFVIARHTSPVLLDAIAAESPRHLRDFAPQTLSTIAWAYATASHAAPALFDAIAAEAAGQMRDFNPQDFANTAWAYVTAIHASPALFDAIAAEAAGRVREFTVPHMCATAWAFAIAGHAAPALFDAIAAEAATRLDKFDLQGLTSMAWSYAVVDCLPIEPSLFDQRFARQCDALAHEFGTTELRQIHQWRLWYAGERGCSDGLPGAALLARCAEAFRDSEFTISHFQSDVAKKLESIGATVQEEVVIEEGYRLDCVVDWRGERVAVEADGPFHFVGREPNGATLLKRRQLKHFGWRLVSVPYWEWAARKRAEHGAYLLDLLTPGAPAV